MLAVLFALLLVGASLTAFFLYSLGLVVHEYKRLSAEVVQEAMEREGRLRLLIDQTYAHFVEDVHVI